MTSTSHHAVLIGPAADALESLLEELLPRVRVRRHRDLYGAVPDLIAAAADSLWVDAERLGSQDVGALRVLRRALPDCPIALLVGVPHDKELVDAGVALGCAVTRRPPTVRDVALVLQTRADDREREPQHGLFGGLMDQLNNPLAALAGRLQLMRIAMDTDDAKDAADNLGLAIASAERMKRALEKLDLMSGRKRPSLVPLALTGVLRDAIADAGPRAAPVTHGDESAARVTADPELLRTALVSLVCVLSDVGGSDGMSVSVSGDDERVCVRLGLASPVPMPCRQEVFLQPFGLNRVLRDPDLGLDLALANVLLGAQNASLRPLVETGFLTGLEVRLPRGA